MHSGIENKRARFDYEILEEFSAGIVLSGHETKSIKQGHCSLSGAHAIVRNNELYIVGMQIPSFQPENIPTDYDPDRVKKLLMKKGEIATILGKLKSGLTLVPLKVYNTKRGLLKIQLGLGRGLKKHDKRELIKKREIEREIQRFKE